MTKRGRKNLFFFLVSIFVIFGPLTILWSQGYRVDLQHHSLTQVGAILVKTNLADAKIQVGGSIIEARGSILHSGTLIKNLLPRKYEVRLDGGASYWPWVKILEVKPLSVTKASQVFLFPKEAVIVTEPKIPENQNIIFAHQNDYLLYRPGKTPKIDSLSRYLARLFAPEPAPTVIHAKWHPNDSRILFLLTDRGLYRIDVIRNEYLRVARPPIDGFGVSSNVYYLASKTIWEVSHNGKPNAILKLEKTPRSFTGVAEIINLSGDDWLIHDPRGMLAIINREEKLESLGENVRLPTLAPDKQKIAFFEDNNLMLKPLVLDIGGEITLTNLKPWVLKKFDSLPREIFWLKSSWHVMAVFDDHVEIIEIDPRPPLNSAKLDLGPIKSFSFDIRANTLYWLDNKSALKSWTIE